MNNSKKLVLNRETVRKLQDSTLDKVAGGAARPTTRKSCIIFAKVAGQQAARLSCYATDCCTRPPTGF
jgi:hypothetical protein